MSDGLIVKVCGITNMADARAAVDAGAGAIGMIFYPRSPRFVRALDAAMISAVVPGDVLKVGVFVNETLDAIRATAEAARLDVIQLHGDEAPAFARELDGLRLWKAFRVDENFAAEALAEWPVEAALLDGPAGSDYGGTGRQFPWDRALEAKRYKPVIIAGGLDASNVADAIRQTAPFGVDASSRLEKRAGLKDPAKVRNYVEAARAALREN